MARYRMRALMAASSIGLLIGASAGAAYLGGRLARDASNAKEAARLMQVADTNGGEVSSVLASEGARFNPSAMAIANRFAAYGHSTAGQNAMTTQSLAALRITNDIRSQHTAVLRASYTQALKGPLEAGTLMSDHPVRAAAAMVFKAHTQNDADCLTQAVYYEARGEGVDGMRAVAQVILNRVRHPAFPKTICGVVYQGALHGTSCQFSFVCNGAMGNRVESWSWRRARDVASAALEGYVMKSVGTATHFHTLTVDPMWSATMVRVATVGGHAFYQFRGRSAHINGIDGVSPSADMPMIQAAADVLPADGGDTAPAQATPVANTPAAPAPVAANTANVQLISALQRVDTSNRIDQVQKPVQLAARITGKPAEAVVTALTQQLPQAPSTTGAAVAKGAAQ
jgi:spore germination cell wall hydrolase CwlJ-like protein